MKPRRTGDGGPSSAGQHTAGQDKKGKRRDRAGHLFGRVCSSGAAQARNRTGSPQRDTRERVVDGARRLLPRGQAGRRAGRGLRTAEAKGGQGPVGASRSGAHHQHNRPDRYGPYGLLRYSTGPTQQGRAAGRRGWPGIQGPPHAQLICRTV
ncbi:unnamed protein product [Calypogeia fissa]